MEPKAADSRPKRGEKTFSNLTANVGLIYKDLQMCATASKTLRLPTTLLLSRC